MRRPLARPSARGFTLLEVLIATAILGMSIVTLLQALADSPDRANKAKLQTVATLLARNKINDIEHDLLTDGWEDFNDEECGDFMDEEYGRLARFKWCAAVEQIEFPENMDVEGAVQDMLSGKGGGGGSKSGQSMLGSWLGGAMMSAGQSGNEGMMAIMAQIISGFLTPFRNVVERAIRRVTLTVSWKYRRKTQKVVVIYYVTKPDLVESAITGSGMSGIGGAGGLTGGASGSSSRRKK